MLTDQLPLPAFPKKKGRPRIHASREALSRATMRSLRLRKRAKGLRPITIWLPLSTIEAAEIEAEGKQVPRESVLAETLNQKFSPTQQGTITANPPQVTQ